MGDASVNDQGLLPGDSTGATPFGCDKSADVHRTDAVAIVTGGSSGIGRELALELAGRDYAVALVYARDQGRAEAVVDELLAAGGTALAIRADITDELDVERLFDETIAAFGAVDLVVHAAPAAPGLVDAQAAVRLRPGGAIVSARRA
jgi:3-oxoacyl-[acyl-carrier protein] reductase